MRRRWLHVWTCFVVFWAACGPALTDDRKPTQDSEWPVGVAVEPDHETTIAPVTPAIDQVEPPPAEEQCNGLDDDGDGLVDELPTDTPCPLDDGTDGVLRCLLGQWTCTVCDPDTAEVQPCGCDLDRVRTCSDRGQWNPWGACDGCSEPSEPCTVCTPGEEVVRRCDECDDEDDCGETCRGATYRCSDACDWEQITPCGPLEAQCDGDSVRVEDCGECGQRLLHCDTCFWTRGICEAQGACEPGDVRLAPCAGEDCVSGRTAELVCDDTCQWPLTPPPCVGCPLGDDRFESEPCVSGHDCGEEVSRHACLAQPAPPRCEGGDPVIEGAFTRVETVTACEVECLPGQVLSCEDASGDAGTYDLPCTATCEPPALPECIVPVPQVPPVCVPSESSVDCGCGAAVVTTVVCDDVTGTSDTSVPRVFEAVTTVDDSACPECLPGEARSTSCTTAEGECGQVVEPCDPETCAFQITIDTTDPEALTAACDPLPGACVPGVSTDLMGSCGPRSCGALYTETWTCAPDGCGILIADDRAAACPTCDEDDLRTVDCLTEVGECGTVVQTCDDTCAWPSTDPAECVARDEACVPGDTFTETESCGEDTCGAVITTTHTCLPGGCGWEVETDGSACPECAVGAQETTETECITGWPVCGFRDRICLTSCTWQLQECPPCG